MMAPGFGAGARIDRLVSEGYRARQTHLTG